MSDVMVELSREAPFFGNKEVTPSQFQNSVPLKMSIIYLLFLQASASDITPETI